MKWNDRADRSTNGGIVKIIIDAVLFLGIFEASGCFCNCGTGLFLFISSKRKYWELVALISL